LTTFKKSAPEVTKKKSKNVDEKYISKKIEIKNKNITLQLK